MWVEAPPLKRRLTAVLLADVVGYSRLMSLDEEGTHGRIAGYVKELIVPTIAEYGGRPVRNMGDGMLVEFGSALDAVRCGLDIQQHLAKRQDDIQDDRVQLRIGINTGDVIVDDRDIYGHSINVTARLESMAHRAQSASARASTIRRAANRASVLSTRACIGLRTSITRSVDSRSDMDRPPQSITGACHVDT